MSLVSDALKKAEREAAAREARDKGHSPAAFEAPLQPYRSRRAARGRAQHAVLAAGICVVAALALGWWSSTRKAPVKGVEPETTVSVAVPTATGSTTPTSPTVRDAQAPSVPSVEAVADLAPASGNEPAAPQAARNPSAQAPSASEPPPPKPATLPLPKTTPSLSPPSPSASEPQAPRTAPSPAPAAPAKKQANPPGDYLRRADFADGSSLELGGIVYSEAAPFCYLNGRLVGIGEFVLGRRIDRIERDKVVLTGDDGTIVLRLKPN